MRHSLTIFVLGIAFLSPLGQAKPQVRQKAKTCEFNLGTTPFDQAALKSNQKRLATLEDLIQQIRQIPIFIPAEAVQQFRLLAYEHATSPHTASPKLQKVTAEILRHLENKELFFLTSGNLHSIDGEVNRYLSPNAAPELHFQYRLSLYIKSIAGMNGLINYNPAWKPSLTAALVFDRYIQERLSSKRLESLRSHPYRKLPAEELRQIRNEIAKNLNQLRGLELISTPLPEALDRLIKNMALEVGNQRPFFFFRAAVDRTGEQLKQQTGKTWELLELGNGRGDLLVSTAINSDEALRQLEKLVRERNLENLLGEEKTKTIRGLERDLKDLDLVLQK